MSEFTPLSELEGYSSDRLSWRVALPEYVPSENIGLNVSRVEKLARLAGLGHLRIENGNGETTEYDASVIGRDAQGNAVAGMSAVGRKADLGKVSVESKPVGNGMCHAYSWGNAEFDINTTEMSDRIMRGKIDDGSLRSGKAWSKQLNQAVKSGMRKAANKQLVTNVPSKESFAFSGQTGIGLSMGVLVDPGNWAVAFEMLAIAWTSSQIATTALAKKDFGLPPSERRLSFIPGYQVDRLAVVHGLSRAGKLIKKIN